MKSHSEISALNRFHDMVLKMRTVMDLERQKKLEDIRESTTPIDHTEKVPESYECSSCGYTHHLLLACATHAKMTHHANSPLLQAESFCPICNRRYKSGGALISHLCTFAPCSMSVCQPELATRYGIIVNWDDGSQTLAEPSLVTLVPEAIARIPSGHATRSQPPGYLPGSGFQCPLCAGCFADFSDYRDHFLEECTLKLPTTFTVDAIALDSSPFDAFNTPSYQITGSNPFQASVGAALEAGGCKPRVFGSFGTLYASPSSDIDYTVDCYLSEAIDVLVADGFEVQRLGGKGNRQHLKVYAKPLTWRERESQVERPEHVDVVPLKLNTGLKKKRILSNASVLLPILPVASRIVKEMARACNALAPGTRAQSSSERHSSQLRHNLMWACGKTTGILDPPSLCRTLSPADIHGYLGDIAEVFDTSSPSAMLEDVIKAWIRYNRRSTRIRPVDICGDTLSNEKNAQLPYPLADRLDLIEDAMESKTSMDLTMPVYKEPEFEEGFFARPLYGVGMDSYMIL
eukprot:gnl/Dysnectes_brevis/2981_a3672_1358.p1 GENE.gnl/Dysnectes_brevis/2981_a3672_1358~~gnl/Dysnectes_brevis/2981_a3672_1358.p1  ORF type:complete len:518 (-),score=57.19 gnl/Dysnectes_brevis/2981_a3672_1358:77-1630(-)